MNDESESRLDGPGAFTKNNEQVPEALAQDIRKSLSKSLQELRDLDAQLQDLHECQIQLETKRFQFHEQISQHKIVLSPIRRLPFDVLHEIFYHSLPTNRDPAMSSMEAPLLLTHICRTWRHVAHMSPRLWAQIYITFSDDDPFENYEADTMSDRTDVSNFLRLRYNAVEDWLSRSGDCPLSVSILYSRGDPETLIIQPRGEISHARELFRVLAQFSHRFQNLELDMPMDVYLELEDIALTSHMPLLDSLRVSVDDVDEEDNSTTLFLKAAQRVTKLSFSGRLPDSNYSTLRNVNPTNLTYLVIHCWGGLGPFLRCCPNLEILKMSFALSWHPFPEGPISLPRLRVLALLDIHYSGEEYVAEFYESVEAPRLEWLAYSKPFTQDFGGIDPTDNRDHHPITSLLRRSPKLKKFIINADGSSTSDVRRMLRAANSVTHLVFGTNSLYHYVPPRDIPSNVSDPRWHFGALFLQDEDETETGCGQGQPLLPSLEVLEVPLGLRATSDEKLQDIILRRANSTLCGETKPLKRVAVRFERRQERDILRNIFAVSEQTGHQIKLELAYQDDSSPPPDHRHNLLPAAKNPLSPWYGVKALGDCTWDYSEIEFETEVRTFLSESGSST